MKVIIGKNYYFEVEDNQFILYYTYMGKDKNGKPRKAQKVLGYLTSIERVIHRTLQHAASRKDVTISMEAFMKKWRDQSEKILGVISKHDLP
jgi:hypothetical protein